jgi:hypothetical protein
MDRENRSNEFERYVTGYLFTSCALRVAFREFASAKSLGLKRPQRVHVKTLAVPGGGA